MSLSYIDCLQVNNGSAVDPSTLIEVQHITVDRRIISRSYVDEDQATHALS